LRGDAISTEYLLSHLNVPNIFCLRSCKFPFEFLFLIFLANSLLPRAIASEYFLRKFSA